MTRLGMDILGGKNINLVKLERNAQKGLVSPRELREARDVFLRKGDVNSSRRMAALLKEQTK